MVLCFFLCSLCGDVTEVREERKSLLQKQANYFLMIARNNRSLLHNFSPKNCFICRCHSTQIHKNWWKLLIIRNCRVVRRTTRDKISFNEFSRSCNDFVEGKERNFTMPGPTMCRYLHRSFFSVITFLSENNYQMHTNTWFRNGEKATGCSSVGSRKSDAITLSWKACSLFPSCRRRRLGIEPETFAFTSSLMTHAFPFIPLAAAAAVALMMS